MLNVEIRPCTEEDLDLLQKISIETYTDTFGAHNTRENLHAYLTEAYAPDKLKRELVNPESHFFFLYVDEQLAGYLKVNTGAAQTEDKIANALEVERIYVDKAFKRMGLGKRLIEKALSLAKEYQVENVWLGVWEYNENARKFYEMLGFVYTDSHSFFMGDDEQTDLIVVKSLTEN